MSLAIGTQLGSHEITALLGKGGMGEVYRARDTKLKREVAIKILPDEFSRDPERLARFQREAEVLASLNHPNIAAIYDVDEANSSRFLVLEFVGGETLAEQIRRGPIPLEDALKIATQICEALGAAHEKGIVHRDLKPANIKVTSDGKVKVLDFGLAKALEISPASWDFSNSPTVMTGSMPGTIMGTALVQRAIPWATGMLAGAIIAGLAIWSLKPAPVPEERPVSRAVVPLLPGQQLAGLEQPAVAVSPDGTQLAYVASDNSSVPRLYLASGPFFLPDGQWIGFSAEQALKKVAVSGGATLTLSRAPIVFGATWGPNDMIVVSPINTTGLFQVSAAGGAAQPLTTLKEGELSHRWPAFLPGGKAILFAIANAGNPEGWQIAVQRFDTGERKILVRGGSHARYVPTGHLVSEHSALRHRGKVNLCSSTHPVSRLDSRSRGSISAHCVPGVGKSIVVPRRFCLASS